jgi:hypothetical protein
MGQLSYTTAQVESATRKSLNPSRLHAAQDNDTPFTTASLSAGVPTIVVIPLVLKDAVDFSLVVDEFVFDAAGVTDRLFLSAYGTSMSAVTNNTVITTELLVDGVPVQGSSIETKITSNTIGSMAQSTYFKMSTGAVLAFRVTSSLTSTVTFSRTSANVTEVN